jgi:hypothetical protein
MMFDYGGKTILRYEEESCYAELVILRCFLKSGWDGVWVETFGGQNYLRTMPSGWALKPNHVPIPAEKEELLRRIWATAKSYACFDVFTWKGDWIVFCEAKRAHKDRLTKPQFKFIEAAIACGIPASALVIVEWSLAA